MKNIDKGLDYSKEISEVCIKFVNEIVLHKNNEGSKDKVFVK